jgi:hypothetical protein
MGSDQHDVTIRIPGRALRIIGAGALALVLVGAGVGAGLAASSGDDSSASATAASNRRATRDRPDATTTTTTVAPVDVAPVPAGGGGNEGNRRGGDADNNGGGAAAGQDVAPLPPPTPAAGLQLSAATLPVNCGTAIPTFSVRWSTVGATSMEIALGGAGFGPAPLNGSRLYPLPCAGAVSVCGRATNAVGAVTLQCTNASF